MKITYLESLVLESNANEFLVALGVLFVAGELELENIDVEVYSTIDLFQFSIHL